MEPGLVFLPLLLLLLLAFVVPVALARLRWLPMVVGEILVGILIGPSGFNFIRHDLTLDFLAEIGLALLMFLSGLEIDFSLLTQAHPGNRRQQTTRIAAFSFILTLGLAGLTGWYLVRRGIAHDPFMLGLILSTTSLGVVVPILKERGISPTPFGQTVILAALMADFFTMFLITVYVAVISHGLSLKILVVGVLFVVALLAYRLGIGRLRRLHLEKVLPDLYRTASQVKIQGAMALMLAFVVLAKFLGTEMILGAFLAGAVLSLIEKPADEQTRHRLEAIGFGFFVPIFFINVGIGFNFRMLLQDKKTWILVPTLVGAAFLIKTISSLVMRISFSWRETFAGGLLLSSRLSLIIAASGIGLSLGIIEESTNAAFILVAAVTSTFSPLLFNGLVPMRRIPTEKNIVVFGGNSLALKVARELTGRGTNVKMLVQDENQRSIAENAGFQVIPISSEEFDLSVITPATVRALVITDTSDSRNLRLCRAAVDLKIGHIVVLVNDPAKLPLFEEMPIQAFVPSLYQSTLLALMASNPDLFNLLSSTREDQMIRQMYLVNRQMERRRLQDIQIGPDILVLSIRRRNERMIPHGKTRLEIGDRLTVLGSREALNELMQRMEGQIAESMEPLH